MKRDFEQWFMTVKDCIAGYQFFVNYEESFRTINSLKEELKILETLIGSKNIEKDFESLITKYPEVVSCIPSSLAVRGYELHILEEDTQYSFSFEKMNYSIDKYAEFMRKTGLFELFESKKISNLSDYVLGVEVGLSTHSRKNRIGKEMEKIVARHIRDAGYIFERNYLKQANFEKALKKWNLDIEIKELPKKKFDFILLNPAGVITVIETNFSAVKVDQK